MLSTKHSPYVCVLKNGVEKAQGVAQDGAGHDQLPQGGGIQQDKDLHEVEVH